MGYNESTFVGDELHTICCTGDAVRGDKVAFERAVFGGSLRRPQFLRFEFVRGEIVAESYGANKQQHTFTILLADGSKTRIKGRNLYRNGTFRQPWADESLRHAAATEKHNRGDVARAQRAARVEEINHLEESPETGHFPHDA